VTDLGALATNWQTSSRWSGGDFNYDAQVNLADFNLLAANFGLSVGGPSLTPQDWSALAAAVPEPGGPIVALLSLGFLRRLRRVRVRPTPAG